MVATNNSSSPEITPDYDKREDRMILRLTAGGYVSDHRLPRATVWPLLYCLDTESGRWTDRARASCEAILTGGRSPIGFGLTPDRVLLSHPHGTLVMPEDVMPLLATRLWALADRTGWRL